MLELDSITCGDCLELMKGIEDNSVDLVLTDPPYGVDIEYVTYKDSEDNWYRLMDEFIPEAIRVAKMVIMPSCQIKRMKWIYQYYPPDWLICWYKGSCGASAYIGFNDWEPILVYGKNGNLYMHDYIYAPNNEKLGNYGHPCPKPIGWASWFISRASKEGDIILDPFCGSGTTAVACVNLNRHFYGIELSEEYCNIANKRVEEAKLIKYSQPELF